MTVPAVRPEAPSAQRHRRRSRRIQPIAYALALPILVYEAVFVLYPIVQGAEISFTDAKLGARNVESVGFANYERLFQDPAFWSGVVTTLTYAFGVVIAAVGCGLGTALLVNRRMRGRSLVRGLLMAPWAFPEIATVLIFIWILNPTFGIIKMISPTEEGWLTSSPLSLFSIVLISTWKTFPFYSIVLLASLQNVPDMLVEAARVDGANAFHRFWHVTLPTIRADLVLLSLLAFIFAFRQFTLIWLTTGGGPGRDTETLVVSIYNTAFRFYDRSYGATIGVASLVITFAVTLGFLAVQRRLEGKR